MLQIKKYSLIAVLMLIFPISGCSYFNQHANNTPSAFATNSPGEYDENSTTSYYDQASFSPTEDMVKKFGIENIDTIYKKMVKTTAQPVWTQVRTKSGISLEVPYSDKWAVADKPLQPIFLDNVEDQVESYRFGRFISGGTYMVHEYILDVKENDSDDRKLTLKDLEENAKYECFPDLKDDSGKPFYTPPKIIKVNMFEGVNYLIGGAKGCATIFDFILKDKIISLRKIYDIGKDDLTHFITPEMEHIISSITYDKK